MDYFALDRPRVYLPLSRSAVEEHCSNMRQEGPQHPHIIMDARPTKGARDFVLVHAEGLATARERARKRHTPTIDEALKDYSDEEIRAALVEEAERAKAAGTKPDFSSPREYRERLLSIAEIMDREVQLELLRTNAVRVAVMAHSIGGDWRCYASSWGEERPEFPPLHEDGAFDVRLKFVSKLAEEDVMRLNRIAMQQSELTEDEGKKSGPAPS